MFHCILILALFPHSPFTILQIHTPPYAITGAFTKGIKRAPQIPILNAPKFLNNFENVKFSETVCVPAITKKEAYRLMEEKRTERRVGVETALQYSSAASVGRIKRGRDCR